MFKHEQSHKSLNHSKYTMFCVNNKCSSDQVTNVESVSTIITTCATHDIKPPDLVSISFNNHHIVTRIGL